MRAVDQYLLVLKLSQRMLAAGMAQEWDELIALERQRLVLLENLPKATDSDSVTTLAKLIQQIAECDAQLREKIDAWMTHARIILRMDPPEI